MRSAATTQRRWASLGGRTDHPQPDGQRHLDRTQRDEHADDHGRKTDILPSLFDTSVLNVETNVNLLLQALNEKTGVNILSEPRIFTSDNQEAEFFDGQDIPFVTDSQTNAGERRAVVRLPRGGHPDEDPASDHGEPRHRPPGEPAALVDRAGRAGRFRRVYRQPPRDDNATDPWRCPDGRDLRAS